MMNFVLKMMDFRYASAWFGVLRKDLNGRLASCKRIGRAKGRGAAGASGLDRRGARSGVEPNQEDEDAV